MSAQYLAAENPIRLHLRDEMTLFLRHFLPVVDAVDKVRRPTKNVINQRILPQPTLQFRIRVLIAEFARDASPNGGE